MNSFECEILTRDFVSQGFHSIYAILLAGGTGSRYGGKSPKQFLELNGETLLRRTVRRFRGWGFLKSLVLVINFDYILEAERELSDLLEREDRIVEGGTTRHESTVKGLQSLKEMGVSAGDHVFIQDVARPFFLYQELNSLLAKSREVGAATLASPNPDTILRESNDGKMKNMVGEIVPREGLYRVKTPQIAEWSVLEKLQSNPLTEEPTDLCTWCMGAGIPAGIVPTGEWNLKITSPGDLELAEAVLASLQATHPDLQ